MLTGFNYPIMRHYTGFQKFHFLRLKYSAYWVKKHRFRRFFIVFRVHGRKVVSLFFMCGLKNRGIVLFLAFWGLIFLTNCGAGGIGLPASNDAEVIIEDTPQSATTSVVRGKLFLSQAQFDLLNSQNESSTTQNLRFSELNAVRYCAADEVIAVPLDPDKEIIYGTIYPDCTFRVVLDIGNFYTINFFKDGEFVATIDYDQLPSPLLFIPDGVINLGSVIIDGNLAWLADEENTLCILDGDGDGISICEDPDESIKIVPDGEEPEDKYFDESIFECVGHEKKMPICHSPPGNPDNARTLCVGISSYQYMGHLLHGDDIGPCDVVESNDEKGDNGKGKGQDKDKDKDNNNGNGNAGNAGEGEGEGEGENNGNGNGKDKNK